MGVGERQSRYGAHVDTVKTTYVKREDNGKLAGTQTEHWDDRVDANILAPTIIKNSRTGEVTTS